MVNLQKSQFNNSVKTETIILVPGLAFGGIELYFLASGLRKRGYQVTIFYHCPFCNTFDDKAKRLATLLKKINSPIIHFLGCSMGGLIVLDFLARNSNQRAGKVVLLGSPINGSIAAQRVLKFPFGRFIIGKCLAASCFGRVLPFPNNRDVGAITGSKSFVFGKLFGLSQPNDGLVATQETQHPNMTDTSIFAVSHYSMIFSSKVVDAIDLFFRTSTFFSATKLKDIQHFQAD